MSEMDRNCIIKLKALILNYNDQSNDFTRYETNKHLCKYHEDERACISERRLSKRMTESAMKIHDQEREFHDRCLWGD